MYYSVSQAGFLLGVCPTTIRRWDKNNLIRCIRTPGSHRRVHRSEIERRIKGTKRRYSRKKRGVVSYARVSSHEQKKKGDLNGRLLKHYCEENDLRMIAKIKDVASGLNTKRKGIKRLFNLVSKGKISEVVISYRDRLTRFGFEYLKNYFSSYGVKVTVLKARQSTSVQQEMVDDLIAIITSFSGKIHRMRSRRQKFENKILTKCKQVP